MQIPSQHRIILIDASWDTSKRVGIRAIMYNAQGELTEVQYSYTDVQDDLPSWRSVETVVQCATYMQNNTDRIILRHIGRIDLKEPHTLATLARTKSQGFRGIGSDRLRTTMKLSLQIDNNFLFYENLRKHKQDLPESQ